MNIDYYCFVMDKTGDIDYRAQKEKAHGHIFDNMEFDIEVAKKLKKFACYYKDEDKFFDENMQELDIRGKNVFPRCTIPEMNNLFDKIDEFGAIPVVSKSDTEKVFNWPNYIQPLNREVTETTYGEFLKNFNDYKRKYGRVFFKTKQKNVSTEVLDVVSLAELGELSPASEESGIKKMFGTDDFYLVFTKESLMDNDFRFNFIKRNSPVFVEPYLNIAKDEEYKNIPVEYRSFVVDGKFVSSRSWVANREVPKTVNNIVKAVIKAMPDDMSKTFVVDVLEYIDDYGDRKYDICELNPITCSGYEIGSTIFVLEDTMSNKDKCYKGNKKQDENTL